MKRETIDLLLIAISAIAVLFGLLSRSPIPQDLAYHNFSDSVGLFYIPNILNVLSNLPFLVVGLLALYKLTRLNLLNVISENKFA